VTRVFVIHVPEDYQFFDRLSEQARTAKLTVEFDRMQAKQPWVPAWKQQAWNRIYKCAGAIVLLSKNTNQGGLKWELECAQKFDLPLLGVHLDKARSGNVPEEIAASSVIDWNWPEIARFIRSLDQAASA
jgi:hypothetical protein